MKFVFYITEKSLKSVSVYTNLCYNCKNTLEHWNKGNKNRQERTLQEPDTYIVKVLNEYVY